MDMSINKLKKKIEIYVYNIFKIILQKNIFYIKIAIIV